MGFDSEYARAVVLDLETAPIDGVEAFLEPGEPPSNYKAADAIERWQADYKANQIAKAALDLDLCRIVCLGALDKDETSVWLCVTEQDEKTALEYFWAQFAKVRWVGFNCLGFDLPVLLRRSLYLGVTVPHPPTLDKYRHPGVTDVLAILSNNGAQKMRSLAFYLKRFGLPATDGKGSEIPALVASGDWAGVEAHNRADLVATAALARRIGCL